MNLSENPPYETKEGKDIALHPRLLEGIFFFAEWSGFCEVYIGSWCEILEAKRSILGVQRILQIFLKIIGCSFFSLKSVINQGWKSAKYPINSRDFIYDQIILNFPGQIWKQPLSVSPIILIYVSATVLFIYDWATFTYGNVFVNDTLASFAALNSRTFACFLLSVLIKVYRLHALGKRSSTFL